MEERIIVGTRNGVTAARDSLCGCSDPRLVQALRDKHLEQHQDFRQRTEANRGNLSLRVGGPHRRIGASVKALGSSKAAARARRDFFELSGSAFGLALQGNGTRFAVGGTRAHTIFEPQRFSLVSRWAIRGAWGDRFFSYLIFTRCSRISPASREPALALDIDEERPTLLRAIAGWFTRARSQPDGKMLATGLRQDRPAVALIGAR